MNLDSDRPQNRHAEQAALGAAILKPSLASRLNLAWFYDPEMMKVAKVLKTMVETGTPIDTVTIGPEFYAAGLRHSLFIDLIDSCHSVYHLPAWKEQLEKAAMERAVLLLCEDFHDRTSRGKFDFSAFQEAVSSIQEPEAENEEDSVESVMNELIDEWERAANGEEPPGVKTGFHEIDRSLGWMQPGSLNIVAARPSVGKTSLGLNVALRVAQARTPVALFSLEMPRKQLIHRLWCNLANVNSQAIARGELTAVDFVRVDQSKSVLRALPLQIRDKAAMTVSEIRAECKALVKAKGVKLAIIDYLGLIQPAGDFRSRYESITAISNGLKQAAMEINIPFLVLCQLNRDVDKSDRAPRLSDLRDSGAIEQDADVVMLLHAANDRLHVIIAKNRHGPSGDSVELHFDGASSRMETMATKQASEQT